MQPPAAVADDALLTDLRRVAGSADPVPVELLLSISIAGLGVEFGRELCTSAASPGGFPGAGAATRAAFESASLTIMLEWTPGGNGTVRLDGRLAPPSRCRVEIRTAGGRQTVETDEGGRFTAGRVRRGEVRLRVRSRIRQAGGFRNVVTPPFVL